MVDHLKHAEFKTYLSNLDIKGPIKYFSFSEFEIGLTVTHYLFELELDESITDVLDNYLTTNGKHYIVPVDEEYINMYYVTFYERYDMYYGDKTPRENQRFFVEFLKEKSLINIIPHCNNSRIGMGIINTIVNNQEYYLNKMNTNV